MKSWQIPLIVVALLLLSVFSIAYVKQDSTAPLPAVLFELPDFAFEDVDGGEFSNKDLNGKLSVLSFFFTSCPATCPAINSEIARIAALNNGRNNLQFISISLDPERDSSERIRDYAKRYRAIQRQWRFLRGPKEKVEAMLNSLKLGLGPDISSHSTRLILVDAQGGVRGYYDPFEEGSMLELQDHLERF